MHTSTAGSGTDLLGKLPYAAYRRVLRVSAAHVYLYSWKSPDRPRIVHDCLTKTVVCPLLSQR